MSASEDRYVRNKYQLVPAQLSYKGGNKRFPPDMNPHHHQPSSDPHLLIPVCSYCVFDPHFLIPVFSHCTADPHPPPITASRGVFNLFCHGMGCLTYHHGQPDSIAISIMCSSLPVIGLGPMKQVHLLWRLRCKLWVSLLYPFSPLCFCLPLFFVLAVFLPFKPIRLHCSTTLSNH